MSASGPTSGWNSSRGVKSCLGAHPGTGQQDLADLEEQQRHRLRPVALAGDGAQGEQEALHGVGDLLAEHLSSSVSVIRLISFRRTLVRA